MVSRARHAVCLLALLAGSAPLIAAERVEGAGSLPAARWTMYYITEVGPPQPAGQGVKQSVVSRTGKKISYHLTPQESRDARREAAAYVVDEEGTIRVAAQTEVGSWKVLPEGLLGLGNRSNPLVPWKHVAADQKRYPYGSRVHLPKAIGYETPDKQSLSGYFYVADVGYGVNSDHFDLFVGFDKVFSQMMERKVKQQFETKVEKLPAARPGLDPLNPSGLAALFVKSGFKVDPADAASLPNLKHFKILPRENSVTKCLVAWQMTQKEIPAEEYGSPAGAATLWHLHELAARIQDT